MIKFGPSGAPIRFYDEGFSSTEQMPKWLKENGLDCFEYSFGRGVNLSSQKAQSIGKAFLEEGVEISVHAPYFINLATPDEQKCINSFGYITDSAIKGKMMGANRLVFHPASQGKEERAVAFSRTLDRIKILADIIYEGGLEDIKFCPETMGKIAQIGTLEEVVEFCKVAPFYYPCVDFGHLNAREQGSLKTASDYISRIEYMIEHLGFEKVNNMHVHFSKIQYTAKGELKHLTFEDTEFGPSFEPFIEAITTMKLTPYILSESNGTQADDAFQMKKYYNLINK